MWRFGTPILGKSQVAKGVTQAKDLYLQHHPTLPEAKIQMEAVCKAAILIVESGALGPHPVQVTLGGHANPDFHAREGWIGDQIVINIGSAPGQPVISSEILPQE